MTSAYILILAILVLGGAIATLGDRIGTKVGKARLSLFNLRPKKTAVVITIITGITISASTLGLLFATSKSLRTGVFELDEKLNKLRQTRKELTQVATEKGQVEAQLSEARTQQIQAQQQLDAINQSLQAAIDKQAATETQLKDTQNKLTETQSQLSEIQTNFQRAKTQLSLVESKFERAQSQLTEVSEQAQTLRSDIENLQTERQDLIEQQEQVRTQIAQRDLILAQRKQEMAQQEQEIAQQKQEIAQQKQEIANQEQEIANQEQEISQREQQIANQEREISDQNQEISQQKQEIGDREQEIAAQKQEISQREGEIVAQKQEIRERDREIQERNQVIAEREKRLKDLEAEQGFLERQVEILERDFQILREGTVALLRNQVLTSVIVRRLNPTAASQAADKILQAANLAAIQLLLPGTTPSNQQVIQITDTELGQLIEGIDDGREYVVRILSAANYLIGEKYVDVFADVAPNKVVFLKGEVVATISVAPSKMTGEQIRQRLDFLLALSNFRAGREGIVASQLQIGDGRIATLIQFIDQLRQYDKSVSVQAIASGVTYTAGPLTIELVVVQNGQIIFRTG